MIRIIYAKYTMYTLVFIQEGIFRRLADQRNSNIEGFADKCGHHIFF